MLASAKWHSIGNGGEMKRLAVICLSAFGLSGCITTQMNDGLGFLVGQDIQVAVSKIGYPAATREMLGDTLYIWSTNQNVALPVMTTQNTTGMIGSTPVWGQTTGMGYVPASFVCTIQLAVGPDHLIKSWQWEGNFGGCERYARALKR